MEFITDFHVHSKYSRATAKNLDLEHLYIAAQIKGITVVGTGDFTHPGWFSEIKEKLEPAEPGLYRLKREIAHACDKAVPSSCKNPVRFILVTEISNIYKKGSRTRKNHNLVFLPDIEHAETLNAKLDAVGNITSDGRPILGLDAKHLLEILLGVTEKGFLVPAHIWTPWFSLLGSKSGFDSLEECFEDLTPYIFAVETGLSSDPAMNRKVSGLDRLTLISNSDAHSPFYLGREANRFNTGLSYDDIRSALKTGDPNQFLGTFEFYPEEGKYHYDGHRKCNICFHPEESLKHNGICPVCNTPLTLGVLYRVMELADRKDTLTDTGTHPYYSIIPLTDILADIFTVGPKTKKVLTNYDKAVNTLGPEFDILHTLPIGKIQTAGIPLLGEAVKRMRENRIRMSPGFDGEFGKVKIFDPEERRRLMGQKSLFVLPGPREKNSGNAIKEKPRESDDPPVIPAHPVLTCQEQLLPFENCIDILSGLNDEQKKAVTYEGGPQLIVAGPGTGKTRTLTCKIAYLISEKNISPRHILAVTFTNKAAREMRERLETLVPGHDARPFIATIHSFCYTVLTDHFQKCGLPVATVIDDTDQRQLAVEACRQVKSGADVPPVSTERLIQWIATAKQKLIQPGDDLSGIAEKSFERLFQNVYRRYQEMLTLHGVMDFEDLILKCAWLFKDHPEVLENHRRMIRHLFVDEYQDLNYGQYYVLKALAEDTETFCVIGDPDQAIYGFRGSDPAYFNRFRLDFPQAKIFTLKQNYRSTETILKGSYQVIQNHADKTYASKRVYSGIHGSKTLCILSSASEKAEAVAIGKTIENLIGGTGFHAIDFNKLESSEDSERSFSDFAVLYRTRSQAAVIADVFEKAGIPCQIASRNNLFEEKGIRELISFFKLVEGIGQFRDLERIIRLPGSGIGGRGADQLKNWYFQKQLPLNDAMAHIRRLPIAEMSKKTQLKLDRLIAEFSHIQRELNETPIENRLHRLIRIPILSAALKQNKNHPETMRRITALCREFPDDAPGFVTALSLQSDTDAYHPDAQKVTLMTLHASKGLEFPVVFIAGCENGLIPYAGTNGKDTDMEEERRLFYVAMTRAKEQLYLTWSKKRMIYGKSSERKLSPFVQDIENQLLKHKQTHAKKKKHRDNKQLTLFP